MCMTTSSPLPSANAPRPLPRLRRRFGPLPLTGFDYERRHGAVATSAITAAENCILRAKRKNKLFTYIICPGILYGGRPWGSDPQTRGPCQCLVAPSLHTAGGNYPHCPSAPRIVSGGIRPPYPPSRLAAA